MPFQRTSTCLGRQQRLPSSAAWRRVTTSAPNVARSRRGRPGRPTVAGGWRDGTGTVLLSGSAVAHHADRAVDAPIHRRRGSCAGLAARPRSGRAKSRPGAVLASCVVVSFTTFNLPFGSSGLCKGSRCCRSTSGYTATLGSTCEEWKRRFLHTLSLCRSIGIEKIASRPPATITP